MQTFGVVANSVVTLFICVVLGFACEKAGVITEEVGRGLTRLLLSVALPCSVLFTMQRPFSGELLLVGAAVFFISAFMFLLGGLLAWLLCRPLRVAPADAGVYMVSSALPNIMFMGAPVLSAAYGGNALFFIYIANIPFTVIAFTVCQKMITAGYDVKPSLGAKEILTNPPLLSAAAGMVMFLLSMRLPGMLNGALSMLGGMMSPLGMLIIGAMLAKSDFKAFLNNGTMYFFIFIRLIALPAAVFFIFRGVVPDDTAFAALLLMTAMPVATMTGLFAGRYGANTALAAQIICASTLLSAVTIPLMAALLALPSA